MKTNRTLWLATLLSAGLVGAQAPTADGRLPALPKGFDPAYLAGKKIVSTIKLSKVENGASPAATGGSSISVAGPSDQLISRRLQVKKTGSSGELSLERIVQQVQMTVVSVLGKSVYDSENTFEQDQVAAALGQRYDPYVRKTFKSVYQPTTGTLSQQDTDPKFDNLWSQNVPNLISVPAFQGFFLRLPPKSVSPGSSWKDSVVVGSTTWLNTYKVLSQQGEILVVRIENRGLTGAGSTSQTNRSGAVTATSTSDTSYEGEARVRQSSGFIEELDVMKKSNATVLALGQNMRNSTTSRITVKNTVD
ncbi:hypothetical protein [Hymenobacter rubripertinctus]|uniref:Uncharacterized protein n=1 Tax=Hymenobacter rubripertinctus TaxID=2029981 RepID=A0A418R7T9_9BACT|nr:hypothetical protein [Hymenobacter rubripertinctus]RIY13364.1 hypothetical protein D0T11_02715 [Hymenobacter rubripertinctus]